MDEDKCIGMAQRVAAMETDIRNIQDGNKIFRDEIRGEVRELRKQNDAIYEIATSVKLIAQDIQGVKDDMKEVKDGQQALSEKVDGEISKVKKEQEKLKTAVRDVDTKEATGLMKLWHNIREKLLWLFLGGVALYLLNQALPFLNT